MIMTMMMTMMIITMILVMARGFPGCPIIERGDGDYDNDVVKYDIMVMEMIMMSMVMVMFITEWSSRLPDHRGDGDRSVNRVRNLAPVVNFITKRYQVL